jgi:hypothetical protein
VRIKIESAICIRFAKVETEVTAPWIPRLSVKQVKVLFVIEVAEAVLNVLITEIVIIRWKVFRKRSWSERACHGGPGGVGEVGCGEAKA